MNTLPDKTTASKIPSWVRRRWMLLVGTMVILSAISAVSYAKWARQTDPNRDVPLFAAKRGALTIGISKDGKIQNRDLVILRSEVEGKTTILDLIAEGTQVKVGDQLIELDASPLEDARAQQEITLVNVEAAFIRAKVNREITISQGESDIAKAELAYQFAQLDLQKYTEGEYPKQLQQAESEITIATEELQRASDELDWSRQLAGEGYITATELLADELAMKRSSIKLELAETNLKLLLEFTHRRTLEQLQSDVEQTRMALERASQKATANNVQAAAELTAKESELQRQGEKLTKIDEQITKCIIVAPIDGMAVYATTGGGRHRPAEPLAVQQDVYKMQELIHLPTSSSMMVEVAVPEASIRKIAEGMPVRISVEALPDRKFRGRVGKIGLIPGSSWWRPGITEFSVEIYLTGDAELLRSGMSCRAEIIVARYDDVVYVPLQAVVRTGSRYVVYLMEHGEPSPRTVTVGLDNNRMIHITDGLAEGEEVLLNPPLDTSTAPEDDEDEQFDTDDETAGQDDETQQTPKLDFEAFKNMSTEQRMAAFVNLTAEQRAAFFANLTEEQRKAITDMRQQAGGGQQRRPGGGRQHGPRGD